MTAADHANTAVYDHEKDPCIGWLTVRDGSPVPLLESQAWEIAWALIGACIESKQFRATKEAS